MVIQFDFNLCFINQCLNELVQVFFDLMYVVGINTCRKYGKVVIMINRYKIDGFKMFFPNGSVKEGACFNLLIVEMMVYFGKVGDIVIKS